MKRRVAWLALAGLTLLAGDTSQPWRVRGKTLNLARLEARTDPARPAVIFLPGDGGWRGAAVSMGRTVASWGYDVYGFDTKSYLETFSSGGAKLTQPELAADLRALASQVAGSGSRRVILIGWSQGASMAVAALAGRDRNSPITGLVTLGLPETGVLGWDWKATLAVIARREPDQPTFAVRPLLAQATPVWMIHGSEDEYTTPAMAQALFQATGGSKRFEEIPGANHRFDGHEDELYRSLRKGLTWIESH